MIWMATQSACRAWGLRSLERLAELESKRLTGLERITIDGR